MQCARDGPESARHLPQAAALLAAFEHFVHVEINELRHVAFCNRFFQENVQSLDLLERHRLAETVSYALLGN